MREDHKVRIETRHRLFKEQKGVCVYCEKKIPIEKASLDHIIPVHYLEVNIGENNLVMCCKRCNKNKGNMFIFTNLFDRIIYPIQIIPTIYQDYYIHSTAKVRKSF